MTDAPVLLSEDIDSIRLLTLESDPISLDTELA